jgi:hypothetical protein
MSVKISLTIRDEHGMRMLENRVLTKIRVSRPKGEGQDVAENCITRNYRTLNRMTEILHILTNILCSASGIRVKRPAKASTYTSNNSNDVL